MSPRARRRLAGLGLVLLAAATVAMVAVPVWLIRPFSPQTARGVEVAFWLRRLAPVATALAALAAVVIAAWLWRGARWWGRLGAAAAVVLVAAGAWAARQNVFETMFAPLPATRTAAIAETDWVDEGDAVLAVTIGGDSRAYPVRQVAYHHVVHDVAGGVPIVVTY